MVKLKTSNEVVNRGGKRYIAKDGFIEVDEQDMVFFEWFETVETKQAKNESTWKKNKGL